VTNEKVPSSQYSSLKDRAFATGDPELLAAHQTATLQQYFPELNATKDAFRVPASVNVEAAWLQETLLSKLPESERSEPQNVAHARKEARLAAHGMVPPLSNGTAAGVVETLFDAQGKPALVQGYISHAICTSCRSKPMSCDTTSPDAHRFNQLFIGLTSDHEFAHWIRQSQGRADTETPLAAHREERIADSYAALRLLQRGEPDAQAFLEYLVHNNDFTTSQQKTPDLLNYTAKEIRHVLSLPQSAYMEKDPRETLALAEKIAGPMTTPAFNSLAKSFRNVTAPSIVLNASDPWSSGSTENPLSLGLPALTSPVVPDKNSTTAVFWLDVMGIQNPLRAQSLKSQLFDSYNAGDPSQLEAIVEFNQGKRPAYCPAPKLQR
jgi:hypothetical protein